MDFVIVFLWQVVEMFSGGLEDVASCSVFFPSSGGTIFLFSGIDNLVTLSRILTVGEKNF